MLEFKEILIEDKELFENKFVLYGPETSDMCFTTMFIWADSINVKYTVIDDLICLVSFTKKLPPYCWMPFGNINSDNFEHTILTLGEYFNEQGLKLQFRRIPQKDIHWFEDLNSKQRCFEFEISKGAGDYIYAHNDLTNLQGKNFDGKRNHISKFLNLHGEDCEYCEIDETYITKLLKINKQYCRFNVDRCSACDICEKKANDRVINNIGRLSCKGAVIKLDGEIKAFTFGEMLNDNTALIHIEKADRNINGLYPYINKQFCISGFPDAEFVNREEDLEIPGLRKAKLSYHPIEVREKYNVYCVKEGEINK